MPFFTTDLIIMENELHTLDIRNFKEILEHPFFEIMYDVLYGTLTLYLLKLVSPYLVIVFTICYIASINRY